MAAKGGVPDRLRVVLDFEQAANNTMKGVLQGLSWRAVRSSSSGRGAEEGINLSYDCI